MKSSRHYLKRRELLQAAGVAIALPMLEAMSPAFGNDQADPPRRMMFVCNSLGLHAPSFFPAKAGEDYESTKYLDLLADHRKEFTVFSGLSHPDQNGLDGHSSQMTWLTAAPNPGLGGFRNSISVDQFARHKLGQVTRFPSLVLSTHGNASQSYTSGGVMISAEDRPSLVFERMFLQGKPEEIERQRHNLKEGGSILDSLGAQTSRLQKRVSAADRARLDEYLSALRETEREFQIAESWLDRPKPVVDAPKPKDIEADADLIGRTRLLMELVPLIFQTDSTRIISLLIQGRTDVPPIEGVKLDHHNLSHHGQDEEKIGQLEKIETELMKCFATLLGGLKAKREQDATLLDSTAVLLGSNLGNANSHDWHNLPILLAGGKLNHGQHVALDTQNNTPLANLFVTMLRHMRVETDAFAGSKAELTW